MKRDIILVGVGGQGILTMASIIANAAIIDGKDLRMSEVHGMAQRGGTVFTEIRIGSKSSIIPSGYADLMIALEPIEALISSVRTPWLSSMTILYRRL